MRGGEPPVCRGRPEIKSMAVYLISLNKPDENAWVKVRDIWPKRHHILTDHMAFVAPEGVTLTQEIADSVGMDSEGGVSGIVVELDNYGGLNQSALVEWIAKIK